MTAVEKNDENTLINNRIIYLSGDFDKDKSRHVNEKILSLEVTNPSKDIILFIDSRGGEVSSFLAIHDVMKMCRCNIATVAIGDAMSAACMLLVSGTKGKRFATENSRILVHQLTAAFDGKLNEISSYVSESKRLQKILNELFEKYTGLAGKAVCSLMRNESYLSSSEALENGIIDRIIFNPDDLYSYVNI